jgi:predicted Rossmann fold flavoprotein
VSTNSNRVAVIGAGAAGLMAAATAARAGADVTLYEHNIAPGRKLGITGKGRCNLTNDCEPAEFLKNIVRNPRFMYSSIFGFTPSDTMALFESLGVPLKTERGRRVFPVSDKASDIVRALTRYARDSGAVLVRAEVTGIETADGAVTGVLTRSVGEGGGQTASGDEFHPADAVIIATGGMSYPGTGSRGDGYRFARALGHTVTPLSPSLVALRTACDVSSLEGLSLRNVTLTLRKRGGRVVYEELGEMLFTDDGISGPLVLSASAHIEDSSPELYDAEIDLKPGLDEATLGRRILSDFAKYQNRNLCNALNDLLPSKLIPYFIAAAGAVPHIKINSVTKETRRVLLETFKRLVFPIRDFAPIAQAVVTRGGVDVREIDPGTMASRLVSGLYFAGEVIDVDAYTGGFNLQIAFSTGVRAGASAASGAGAKK